MPARYLLDTNTASYIIKGNVPRVRERLLKVPTADVAISVITEAELRFGVLRRPDAKRLNIITEAELRFGVLRRPDAKRLNIIVDEFLRFVEIKPWDSAAALRYAQLRASLEHEGKPMGGLDLMIAAHALALGSVLVTSDRVFKRAKGLKIEDWTSG